jgi:hypothetical protein
MVSKHSAAIKARMRQLGESYYVAREAYLRQQGMPLDPPSQKGARRKEKRLAAEALDPSLQKASKRQARRQEIQREREAAIIAEYGDHLGLDKLPLARPKPSEP